MRAKRRLPALGAAGALQPIAGLEPVGDLLGKFDATTVGVLVDRRCDQPHQA